MDSSYLDGWDPKAENKKDRFLEYLYELSGRTNGLYTGLCDEFIRRAQQNPSTTQNHIAEIMKASSSE